MARQPDLALIDMNMPGMNGIELLEKLSRQRCSTKVVMHTMHNESSIFKRARELGARGYLLKEFAVKELEICLREVADGNIWDSPQLTTLLKKDTAGETTGELEKLHL